MKILSEFKQFAMRGNVIDLAVGVIIGAAFTSIVDSLVKDVFNPLLGLAIGGVDFSNFFVVLKPLEKTYQTLAAAQADGAVTIAYGLFINALIKFSIVAFVVFLLVRGINKLANPANAKPGEAPPPSAEVVLLTQIRDELRK